MAIRSSLDPSGGLVVCLLACGNGTALLSPGLVIGVRDHGWLEGGVGTAGVGRPVLQHPPPGYTWADCRQNDSLGQIMKDAPISDANPLGQVDYHLGLAYRFKDLASVKGTGDMFCRINGARSFIPPLPLGSCVTDDFGSSPGLYRGSANICLLNVY